MLLTIDVGNTQTVLGLFDGDQIVEHWRLATDPRRSADELGLLLTGLLLAGVRDRRRLGRRHRLLLDRAVGVARDAVDVRAMVRRRAARGRRARHSHRRAGALRQPEGSRRRPHRQHAGRHTLHGGPAIVVDFGTSTNFDVVSAHGRVPRRRARPGIEISVDALGVAGRPADEGAARPAAVGDRQEHGRVAAVGHHLRLRRAGRRHHRADRRRARGSGRPSSPPAGWRRSCSRNAGTSTCTSRG